VVDDEVAGSREQGSQVGIARIGGADSDLSIAKAGVPLGEELLGRVRPRTRDQDLELHDGGAVPPALPLGKGHELSSDPETAPLRRGRQCRELALAGGESPDPHAPHDLPVHSGHRDLSRPYLLGKLGGRRAGGAVDPQTHLGFRIDAIDQRGGLGDQRRVVAGAGRQQFDVEHGASFPGPSGQV
jgi:hypothetical protein